MADVMFAVTRAAWLKTEGDRIQGFVLMPKFWGWKWDHKRLRRELHDIGLDYSLPEIAEINDELHKRLIVEDIGGVTPIPGPAPVDMTAGNIGMVPL